MMRPFSEPSENEGKTPLHFMHRICRPTAAILCMNIHKKHAFYAHYALFKHETHEKMLQLFGKLVFSAQLHMMHKSFYKTHLSQPGTCYIIEIEIEQTKQEGQAMTGAITTSAAMMPAADLQPNLFNGFISYIDRGDKTTRTYIANLRQFIAWLAFNGIRRPARHDIIAYREYLQTEHEAIQYDPAAGWTYRTDRNGHSYKTTCSPNTVKQYLQTVRQFFSWTAANSLYPNIAANIHAPKIRQNIHRKDALTAADVLIIEKNIATTARARAAEAAEAAKDTAGRISRATEQGKRLFAMYVLAVNAGLRTVEISRANVKDLELKGDKAVLYVWGKGHAEPDAKKPLAPEVYDALRDYLASRADHPTGASPLFVSTGNRSGGKRIAPTTISKMLKRAMQQAGYDSERLTAHSLRHTAGNSVMEISGNNLFVAQQYMRHDNPATTEIYLHVDTEKQETAIAQELYNLYHNKQDQRDTRQRLENLLQSMTGEQLEQLTGIAAAMAR